MDLEIYKFQIGLFKTKKYVSVINLGEGGRMGKGDRMEHNELSYIETNTCYCLLVLLLYRDQYLILFIIYVKGFFGTMKDQRESDYSSSHLISEKI